MASKISALRLNRKADRHHAEQKRQRPAPPQNIKTTPQRSYDNYDSWYVPDREGKQWRIMSDGSIRAEWNDDGHYRRTTDPEYRVEMVTPKLTYDEMEKFQECVRRIRQAGGKVNDSCGMHVHVDASNHNRQSLKNLLSIMYSKEDLLFKALKTDPARVNRWCQRVREPMLQRARRLSNEPTRDLTQLENIWYEGCISAHEHYNWTRYYACCTCSVLAAPLKLALFKFYAARRSRKSLRQFMPCHGGKHTIAQEHQ